jgi:two-component system, OmpR family, osmolarity sensor histidine kinase EnvZ
VFGAPFQRLKKFLPRSLFGRSLLILVTPLILVQVSLGYIFFDRHTDTILRLLSSNITGEVKTVIYMLENGEDFQRLSFVANQNLGLELSFTEGEKLSKTGLRKETWLYTFMGNALDENLGRPYYLSMDSDSIHLQVGLSKGLLKVSTSRKRLYSRTTPIVLIWTTISALLLFLVASIFMRNQIRPLWRLAHEADQFGKGREVALYRPEGALEVRQVGLAFNLMRERIQRHVQERTAMLAGVSHDLRTPLTRMKLQLSMMTSSPEVENLKEDVDQMHKMVEGFLSFARDAEQEAPQDVNMHKLLKDVSRRFDESKLSIFVNCPKDLTLKLKMELIKRCLTNLLLNSERYSDSVWITVEISGRFVEITLDDNGPGIPEDQREEVFKPFFRLDTSRNSETGGVGLGLSIVRDAVNNHGGQVRLGESPQGGLRVLIRLPQ